MCLPRRFVVVLLSLAFAIPAFAQQVVTTVQRNPQAISIIQQSLSAGGGAATFAAIRDFTATGNITYFWAGQQVQGSVTVRGLGADNFRLDANLSSGTRSWAVSNGQGTVKEANGQTSKIVYENAVNLGALSVPYFELLAAVNDASFVVTFLGQVTVEGRSVYDIRIQKTFSANDDPTRDLTQLSTKDFLFDPQTYSIVGTEVVAFDNENSLHRFQRLILFSDYRQANGVLVPFSVKEKVSGQETWAIQFSAVTFNNGISASVFQL